VYRLLDEIDCLRPTGRSAVFDDYVATVQLVNEFWQHGSLEDRVRAMAEDRQRLQAFVDRLRKTEDGGPIVEGMEVFSVSSHGLDIWDWIVAEQTTVDLIEPRTKRVYPGESVSGLYSTREAAEQARKPCNP
jgi:hypothetical protein